MVDTDDDNKLMIKIGTTAMMMAASIYMLQAVQQLFVPAVVEDEELPFGSPWLLAVGLIMNVGYNEDEEPLYIGEAKPGTLDSDAGWRIYRYDYVLVGGDLDMVGLRFAEGNTKFDKVWDNRADYEYS